MAVGSLALPGVARAAAAPDVTLEIAPCIVEASPRHRIRTIGYNGQVPGPLLRMREGEPKSVEIRNRTLDPEIVHWHGLFLPPEIDGAMEEGTPMVAPGASTRFMLTPRPAGFRWYHTHTFAGKDLAKAQYSGQHGFLLIEPRSDPGAYDREVFLALHDWNGHMDGGGDGFMMPVYDVTTINGKMLGFGDPIQVKPGERVLLHVLNSSPTEVHWIAFAGHSFQVVALDGNAVPRPQTVAMLRLAPAERVCALVEMNNPGVWVLGEVRRHVQAAGMGIVFEYANAGGKPKWDQPEELAWNYERFAMQTPAEGARYPVPEEAATGIALTFDAKFMGHGAEEQWLINGKSYPNTEEPVLHAGQRYRLLLKNESADEHPVHLHRHTFEVKRIDGGPELTGLRKDVLLIPAQKTTEVEFTANHPGRTLLHCHQQDHMDRGFMMVFRYA